MPINKEENDKYNKLHLGKNNNLYKKLIRLNYTKNISTSNIINRINENL